MTKTIIFTTDPESTQVKSLKEQGSVFIINEEKAIKALQVLKNVKIRGDYQVVADEGLKKYLEAAKKMGYQEYVEPIIESFENKEEKLLEHDTFLETTISTLGEGYKRLERKLENEKRKLENERKRLEEEYNKKFKAMQAEHEKKLNELDSEKNKFKKIKQVLKAEIYG